MTTAATIKVSLSNPEPDARRIVVTIKDPPAFCLTAPGMAFRYSLFI